MPDKILVTYASHAGSTAGIAEATDKTLSENGIPAEVRPMNEVQDLSPYAAVVEGSAIQEGKWLPEAMQFVQAHQTELKHNPLFEAAKANELLEGSTVPELLMPSQAAWFGQKYTS
jgi:menaquinone-dependent protoporphyrinogen oxidase